MTEINDYLDVLELSLLHLSADNVGTNVCITKHQFEYQSAREGISFDCKHYQIFDKYLKPRGWLRIQQDTPINPHTYYCIPKKPNILQRLRRWWTLRGD